MNAVAGIAILFLAATGCTGGSPVSAGEGRDGNTPVLLGSADLKLPLDAYLPTPEQVNDLSRARRTLVERCMAGLGFDVAGPGPERPEGRVGLRSLNERRYGLTDAEEAATLGYRLGDRDPAARPRQEKGEWNAAETDALTGEGTDTAGGRPVPEGGCLGEVRRRLRMDGPGHVEPDFAYRLSAEGYDRSRRDPRVREVIGEWSACMADRGFRYADPFAPGKDPRFQGELSALEISAATADVSCKRKTNLVGVWFAVESSYQRALVEEHRDKLQRLRRTHQAELAAARSVLRR